MHHGKHEGLNNHRLRYKSISSGCQAHYTTGCICTEYEVPYEALEKISGYSVPTLVKRDLACSYR